MFLTELIPHHWQKYLHKQISSDYFLKLSEFVEYAYLKTVCYPNKNHIFKIFDLVNLENIKVVILGQDPYHGEGQAQGLSFSVPDNHKLPPSLINIFKEMITNENKPLPYSGNLQYLANQGVFLLNAILTVEAGKPGSHQNKGWEIFTDSIIDLISKQNKYVVFMLWGNYAQKKEKLIDEKKHLILKSGHPSPMSANQGKWFGNNHFNLANDFFIKKNKSPIDWLPEFEMKI